MNFFRKSREGKMNGEEAGDLGDLRRQMDKHQAALSGVSEKIAAIEEQARLEREEAERKQRELASLEKKLAACRANISWFSKKISDCQAVAEAQIEMACDGQQEAAFNLKLTLAEIAGWELAVAAFKKYEASLPEKIKELTASA